MLPKDEQRRLREIEQQLSTDDPKLARRLGETGPIERVRAGLSLTTVLGALAAVLAVACLFLGEGAGMFTATVLAVVLFALRRWSMMPHGDEEKA
ncbi:DUF3040 domain-containing protein [Saccharopolyspora cebuensis]|uniref:DUF3040 domain-containing protein n=1 Tax=Saccharopolyspora cebuensis TaxID=418759 RepID=A0ABV4CU99_9PSEU